jgi:hypothetical protein
VDADHLQASKPKDIEMLMQNSMCSTRYNTLMPSPAGAKYKLAVVQFSVPGAKNGGSHKGPDGNRVDSIPIVNGTIFVCAKFPDWWIPFVMFCLRADHK